jgi:hypothetical protein
LNIRKKFGQFLKNEALIFFEFWPEIKKLLDNNKSVTKRKLTEILSEANMSQKRINIFLENIEQIAAE